MEPLFRTSAYKVNNLNEVNFKFKLVLKKCIQVNKI